jgi:hypothetical protein
MTYAGGGYQDWFLPSKDELQALYAARHQVGWFGEDARMSSSQYPGQAAFVWAQGFDDGHQASGFKGFTTEIRPIRAF